MSKRPVADLEGSGLEVGSGTKGGSSLVTSTGVHSHSDGGEWRESLLRGHSDAVGKLGQLELLNWEGRHLGGVSALQCRQTQARPGCLEQARQDRLEEQAVGLRQRGRVQIGKPCSWGLVQA